MQDKSFIVEALEAARTKLQPGERILTVGKTIYKVDSPNTKVNLIAFAVMLAITGVCLFLSIVPFLTELFSFLFIGCCLLLVLVFIWLLVSPIMDFLLIPVLYPIEEICVITNQRILSVLGSNYVVKEISKKSDVARLQTEKGRLTLTMSDGNQMRMDVIEGLPLSEISSMQ